MRARAVLILLSILVALLPGFARHASADHDDGVYELPSLVMWDDGELSVLIVPPNHGQLFNLDGGVLNGGDPKELTPFNSYLEAMEEAIAAWGDAVSLFGADWLKQVYNPVVYVLGRDNVPPEVMTQPDILVVTDESEGGALGSAIRLSPCVVRMSKMEILSFSYADMYNVTAQEFGHCLGLRHVGSQGGVDPTSDLKHPEHDVMNGFYTHLVGDEDTHLHCISNLDIVALEFAFSLQSPGGFLAFGSSGLTYMPVNIYGTICEAPPADWRMRQPPTGNETPIEIESRITNPSDATTMRRKKFSVVSGVASSTGNRGYKVQVAIAAFDPSGSCEWWDDRTGTFTARDCLSPVWHRANGSDDWTLQLDNTLPTGTYRVLSRAEDPDKNEDCCEKGRNLIEITLTSRRSKS